MLNHIAFFALALATPAPEPGDAENDPASIREIDAIDCRLDVPSYTAFAMAVGGKDGIARQRHWKKVASRNAFLSEYELPGAIVVGGAYSTRRIAFTASGILAILDVADPAVIARAEQIDNTMSAEPLIDAIVASGAASRAQAEAEIRFRKFLGERILHDHTDRALAGEDFGSHVVVARSVSNATTHPGKTFYGCSYRMEILDKDGSPL